MLGLDAGEVDDVELSALFKRGAWIGESAFDETLAGAGAAGPTAVLDALDALRKSPLPKLRFDKIRNALRNWQADPSLVEPWQRGASLARHLRDAWNLGNEPVSDDSLNELFGTDIHSDDLARSKWGKLESAQVWDAARFAATSQSANTDDPARLLTDLTRTHFSAFASGNQGFVEFEKGPVWRPTVRCEYAACTPAAIQPPA